MTTDHTELLVAYLNSARRHVRATLDGLDDEDLRRPTTPSGWTMLGMVQHLALDVERFWFRSVMAGEDVELCTGDQAWQVGADVTAQQVLDAYVAECALADEIIARLPLDAAPVGWPEDWGPVPVESLADAIVHVLKETATHAGHLDIAREMVDGHQHLVLT